MRTRSQLTKPGRSRLVALIAGGVLALGVAVPASADHGHDRGYSQYREYDDDDFRPRGHRYGHFKHHKHHRHSTVHIYHHYPRPVERVRVERHYYPAPEPRTVYVEPRYHETPSGGAYHAGAGPGGGALIGAAVGGLLGSKAGKGTGKLAATAAGTLAGFLIGGGY